MAARSVLYLQPKPGRRDDVVALYRELGIIPSALRQKGCLSVEVQTPPDPDGPILVTADWADRDDYEGWLRNPDRTTHKDALEELLEDIPSGIVYEVVLSGRASGSADT